jgi:mannose-6-phosphate isomerase-like protein (cupin superfamily)
MRIVSKEDVREPLRNPLGEVVYPLIGAPEDQGSAQKHSVAVVVIPPGGTSAVHYHHVSEETYFILRGTARMVIDGTSFELGPGQACLIQPLERHQIFNEGGEDLKFVAVCAPPWVPEDSVFVQD